MRRHKIDILKFTRTTDADGYAVDVWQPITAKSLWANVTDLGSREFYSANAEQREHIIRCNIAYRNDVDESMRIRWKNEDYEIIRGYNGDYRSGFIDLDARRL